MKRVACAACAGGCATRRPQKEVRRHAMSPSSTRRERGTGEEEPPTAIRAILRQLRAERRPRPAQRKRVSDAVRRGLLLPAEIDLLRKHGWLD